MSCWSWVCIVSRTSSCSTPSRRNSSQSPPPAITSPLSLGPSKLPPAMRAMRRRPYGVSPRSMIDGTSSTILNRNSVLISGIAFPPMSRSGFFDSSRGIRRVRRPAKAGRAARCGASLAFGPGKHVHQFGDLAPLLGLAAGCDCVLDTMRDMIAQHFVLDAPQRCAHGRDLGDDVDAITVLFDHAREPAHLAFDPPEPLETR